MMVVGIVQLPGMMTGQILAGAQVEDALRYQIMIYFLIRQPDGPVSGGIEMAMAFVMIGFGSWVVWRRLTGREQG